MARRTSVYEVARAAKVAVSSVSRVLADHPDVSESMRKRVLGAVAELGYEPDFIAQSLRRGTTLSVGFVVGDLKNPLIATIASGAEGVLRRGGYSMLVMDSEVDPALDAAHIRFFQSRLVDGMILLLASERKKATIDLLAKTKAPVVVIDRDLPTHLGVSAVLSDHRPGIRAAIQHLFELGHRRIGFVGGAKDVRPGRLRLAAVQDTLRALGILDPRLLLARGFAEEVGEQGIRELLTVPRPPTAVVLGGNQLLVGCLTEVQRRGIQLGVDLSLVTCDDVPLCQLYQPAIACVSRDQAEIGRVAAELLLERMQRGGDARTVVLKTEFIPRPSCAVPSKRGSRALRAAN
jgi:LacI family transcriptional regulator